MKQLLFILTLVFQVLKPLYAQKTYTISGYVEDAASAEKLISAAVFDKKSGSGMVTNTYGFYSLTLPKGEVDLAITYVGYELQQLNFNLKRDTTIHFKLKSSVTMDEVVVSAKKQDRLEEQVQMSKVTIPIDQIKKIPALMGEVDVLKALQLLPGVQSGGEGQNGLYVRGGSPDQNLILLDGVPVYNVSHIGGFFSVFNGDAIKNVTLTKGGFPARYGGRLSSIIEIDMKEGNMNEFHGEGGIGLIASRLTLEGPIIKDKASFMISGRRTYIDVLMRPLLKQAASSSELSNFDLDLHFYDLNAKVNYKINDKHRLFLSAYNGQDIFGVGTTFKNTQSSTTTTSGINWGNLTTALRWNYLINNKLFSNTTLTYSSYNFTFGSAFDEKITTPPTSSSAFSAKYLSGIKDVAGKVDFDYVPNTKHRVRFGMGGTYHTYNPGAFVIKGSFDNINIDTSLGSISKAYSFEPTLYAEDELQFGALKASIGLHASGFSTKNTFYTSLQPRLGANYLLGQGWALKGSFATMTQYINLLSNESVGLPSDLWVPSTDRIRPQRSWQAAIGTAKTFGNEYEFSVEAYYKKMTDVISYKEGISFLGLENDWESKITQGSGRAYGVEFFVQKKEGNTTGWIGYTLSWNKRQFDGSNGNEPINAGLEFPFRYDRRHDISVVVSHKFTKKTSLTAAWVYGTGNAITLNNVVYDLPAKDAWGNYIRQFETATVGEKNAYRMPSYHRLDINLEFSKKKKNYERKWSIGAYNAYNRANPYTVMNGTKSIPNPAPGSPSHQNVYRQFSLFPIIPSVAYSFKF
jgi:CarboxypepD_reg-like domain/TonB-dependent Receptor Plug Domain